MGKRTARNPISRRRRWLRRTLLGVGAALAAGLLYQAGWGRLMPLLPWTPGFLRVASDRAVVFYHPADRPAALGVARRLDAVVAGVETFHGLRFRFPPEVFLPDSEAEYRRLTGGGAVRQHAAMGPAARYGVCPQGPTGAAQPPAPSAAAKMA